MSILTSIFLIILAGFCIFSLSSNLIYWYENMNAGQSPIPLPRPGPVICAVTFISSLGGYLLCVLLFPFGPLLGRRPRPPAPGDKPGLAPVILVHGLNNNAAVWLYLGGRLRRAGYRVSTYSYHSLGTPLEKILHDLDAHIRTVEELAPGEKPVIVCHSLGGLLARAWLLKPENSDRLRGLITIGTPHGGSKLAVLAPGALAKNLVPVSAFIASLQNAPPLPKLACVSLVSVLDEAVLPASLLVPPEGWKLRMGPRVGHFSLLFCPGTAGIVLDELRKMTEARGDPS